jgi:hypothetical protein
VSVPQHYLLEDTTESQQPWLGEEVEVKAEEDEMAVETTPVDAAAEEAAAEVTEPGRQRLDSPRSSKAIYLTLASDRLPT